MRFVVVALLAAGTWWYVRVPEFRVVERKALPPVVDFNTSSRMVIIKTLLQNPDIGLHFREFGRLVAGSSSISDGYGIFEWSWSPNRHYFAVLDGANLTLWYDGRMRYRLKLSRSITDMQVLDSGHIYCWSRDSLWICLVDDGHIIARGIPPCAALPLRGGMFSPDGSALLMPDGNGMPRYYCYHITAAGGRLLFRHYFTASEPNLFCGDTIDLAAFIGNDRILFRNDAMYGPTGKISPADNWQFVMQCDVARAAPGYAIIEWNLPSGQPSDHGSPYEYRSWNVTTGAHWVIPGANSINAGGFLLTPDGRYVAHTLRRVDDLTVARVRAWLEEKPILKYLRYLIPDDAPSASLNLYEQPGKLRARLPFMGYEYGSFYTDPHTHSVYKLETARLSADGHTLYLTLTRGDGAAQQLEQWRCVW